VILLKLLIKESIFSRENAYSWQTPVGTFYRVHDTHDMDARKRIVGMGVKDAVMSAFQKRYNRIHYYGDTIYVHNEVTFPSEKQVNYLIQLALHNEFEKIVYDGGNVEKILWTLHDVV
jgi:hypothetical protein